jgi:hypothetical protein
VLAPEQHGFDEDPAIAEAVELALRVQAAHVVVEPEVVHVLAGGVVVAEEAESIEVGTVEIDCRVAAVVEVIGLLGTEHDVYARARV